MKIGVALSGCDIGGAWAYQVLRSLEEAGLGIGMVSCCGLPAAGALLYAYGYGEDACGTLARRILHDTREVDADLALAELAAQLHTGGTDIAVPTVVSSVNVPDGRICAFADGAPLASGSLRTYSLAETYDALSATVSPSHGLATYHYNGCQLCDFSVWYGLPVYPLKMAGLDKIVSVGFLPRCPVSPYEVMVKQRIATSAHQADIHISIEFDRDMEPEQYLDAIAGKTEACMEAICMKALF